MVTKEQEREAIETIRKIVEKLGENSYTGFAMDGVLEIAEQNIRDDAAYSLKEALEVVRKREFDEKNENLQLKVRLEEARKEIERGSQTISGLRLKSLELERALKEKTASGESEVQQMPEEIAAELYYMAYDRQVEIKQEMRVMADQLAEEALIGNDVKTFAETYKKQKEKLGKLERAMSLLKRQAEGKTQ